MCSDTTPAGGKPCWGSKCAGAGAVESRTCDLRMAPHPDAEARQDLADMTADADLALAER